jgi:hypothetical protein
MSKLIVRGIWHTGGLTALLIGAYHVAGWAGIFIAFGSWAIIATIADQLAEILRGHHGR